MDRQSDERDGVARRRALFDDIAAFHKRFGKPTPLTAVDLIREIRRERAARLTGEEPDEIPVAPVPKLSS